jgi:WD40 repeat protein
VRAVIGQYNAKFTGRLSVEFQWRPPNIITSLTAVGTALVAVGCLGDHVRIWDVWRGQCVRTIPQADVWTAASLDSELIACVSFNDIKVWNVATGRLHGRLPVKGVRRLVATVSGLAFIAGVERYLEIWHVARKDLVHYMGRDACFLCVMSEGRQIAATFGDDSLRVFDARTGLCVSKLFGVAFGSHQLLGITSGRVALLNDCLLRIWDPNHRFPTTFIDLGRSEEGSEGGYGVLRALGMLDNETLVAMSSAGAWHAWDVITGEKLGTHCMPGIRHDACGSPVRENILLVDGAMVFLGDERVLVYQ